MKIGFGLYLGKVLKFGNLPVIPEGFVFLIDQSGNFLLDTNGDYLIAAAV